MTSLVFIYSGGLLTLLMALFHTRFHTIFKWKNDYEKISVINRKIFHTIHIALFLLFFGLGILIVVYANELSESKGLAFGLNVIIALFWLWRTVWQIFYFKGKILHYVLIVYFFLLFICFSMPVILN